MTKSILNFKVKEKLSKKCQVSLREYFSDVSFSLISMLIYGDGYIYSSNYSLPNTVIKIIFPASEILIPVKMYGFNLFIFTYLLFNF